MSESRVNVLVLGGSPQSLLIADRLAARNDMHVVTSIVGRDDGAGAPAEGDVRIGGFTDAKALADFVRERHVTLLIDAADAFAPDIRRQAADAAIDTDVMRLVFEPVAFEEDDDDTWIRVRDFAEAADLLPGFAVRVMLDVSAADLQAFALRVETSFVVRGAGRDDDEVPLARFERLAARVGASVEQEQAILRQHDVQLIVTRERLDDAHQRLLQAARGEHVPVIMLERPPLPPSDVAVDVDEVLAWVDARLAERSRSATGAG